MSECHNYYAVYNRRTQELICSGTSDWCAKQLGIKRRSFYHMLWRDRMGNCRKYEIWRDLSVNR